MTALIRLSRPLKLDIGQAIHARLDARAQNGLHEEALDAFIPLLGGVLSRLGVHVEGKVVARATQEAHATALEEADCEVDTWLRHHENWLRVEANRRLGPNVPMARALYEAAFPAGASYADKYIPEENRQCRYAIAVIRSPEHAATAKAIGLSPAWTNAWEAALDRSDAALSEVKETRAQKAAHVDNGRDAEVELCQVLLRLRRYIESRAGRADKARWAEGQELLAPMLDALKKARVEKAARRTRREKQAQLVPPPTMASPLVLAIPDAG